MKTRWVWVLMGLVGCMACSDKDDPDEGETPQQRRARLQRCIVTRLPPPTGSAEPTWSVSGLALVGAYQACESSAEAATAADFRQVVQGLARWEAEDLTRVRLTPPEEAAP
ncbi:hypothetical protein LXT21_16665 [Myxococcus sp. K38C18041901]|uniref:hypothetical protein n=1 Tax=Myxococcus guangdongensis TaxID=2906760 RepID=UPI0020A6DF2F|nr:hypothetical protein [Myxococcus guangdongensis]MCP3060414.1 hypothetical protein [Myxococcus guangdongensis]